MGIIHRTPNFLFLYFSVFLFRLVQAEQEFTGKVIGIADGDTISVMHDGKAEKIRLNGIDCPEGGQDFGTKAKQFTSSLAFGQIVIVKPKEKDRYGRTVGDVILPDGKILNQEIVREGFGWWYRYYSTDQKLGDLEKEAKSAKRGLWAQPNAIPPWEFRHPTSSKILPPTDPVQPAPAPTTNESRGPPAVDLKVLEPQKESAPESKSITVYGTATGKKYHSGGCRYLSKSQIPLTIEQAQARGLTPCSVCNPPVIATKTAPAALESAKTPSQATNGGTIGTTVYRTATGAKYHRAGCRYLSNSMLPVSLKDAQASGLGPCSVCNPPLAEEATKSVDSAAPNLSALVPSGTSNSSGSSSTSVGTPSGESTATGLPIYTGPRGGRYHYSKSGKKVYERRR